MKRKEKEEGEAERKEGENLKRKGRKGEEEG